MCWSSNFRTEDNPTHPQQASHEKLLSLIKNCANLGLGQGELAWMSCYISGAPFVWSLLSVLDTKRLVPTLPSKPHVLFPLWLTPKSGQIFVEQLLWLWPSPDPIIWPYSPHCIHIMSPFCWDSTNLKRFSPSWCPLVTFIPVSHLLSLTALTGRLLKALFPQFETACVPACKSWKFHMAWIN